VNTNISKQKRPKALTLSLSSRLVRLTIVSDYQGSHSRLDKSQLPRQLNITANDLSRDYRRINQPQIAFLRLKASDYRQGLVLRVVAFRGLYEDLRIDDLTNPTPTRQPYRAPKGDKSSGGVGK